MQIFVLFTNNTRDTRKNILSLIKGYLHNLKTSSSKGKVADHIVLLIDKLRHIKLFI